VEKIVKLKFFKKGLTDCAFKLEIYINRCSCKNIPFYVLLLEQLLICKIKLARAKHDVETFERLNRELTAKLI
jgi:hypothetical protein